MKTFAKSSLAMIAALSLAAAATGPAWAQPEPGFGGGPGMMGDGPGMMHGDRQQRWEEMQQRHAQRMQELEKQLNLKPDQQAAWKAFKDAQDAWAQSMHAGMQAWRGSSNTPDRFDAMAKLMEQRQSSVKDLAQKAGDLYKVLDQQQKATLDQFTAQPSGFKGKGKNQ